MKLTFYSDYSLRLLMYVSVKRNGLVTILGYFADSAMVSSSQWEQADTPSFQSISTREATVQPGIAADRFAREIVGF